MAPDKPMLLRIPPALADRIEAAATELRKRTGEDIGRSEFARRLIEIGLKQKPVKSSEGSVPCS